MNAAATAAPIAIHQSLPPEESARADFYALLARLLIAPPDGALLETLAAAEPIAEGDPALGLAWQGLVEASSAMDADAAAEEHEVLFAGLGKSEVSLYAGFYGGAPAIDHPRVRIQADLAALGLGRRDLVSEPEDHYGGLFEVMRVLVAGGAGRKPASVGEQRRFFDSHIRPGAVRFFAALAKSQHANFYRHVAAVGSAFTAIETESFQLD